jgi:hypothetical protein
VTPEPRSDGCAATGYSHRRYAESFATVGTPRELPNCGGWLIERAIPGAELRDGMGCYPLFDCHTWTSLDLDLSARAEALVSVTLVTDPFAEVSEPDLRRWFDVVSPYKLHYVTDLQQPVQTLLGRRHSRNVERALRRVHVTTCPEPLAHLDEWCMLYQELAWRHGITGLRAFSRAAFERQLGVPGLVMFRASADDKTVGLHLWYVREQVSYGHLGATNSRGYDLMASYALYWHAIEHFREHVRWLDLGGVAGLSEAGAADGLRQFKAGWATGTRPTFLCGRILQPDAYERLAMERVVSDASYFPAYRHGEFASSRDRHSFPPQP